MFLCEGDVSELTDEERDDLFVEKAAAAAATACAFEGESLGVVLAVAAAAIFKDAGLMILVAGEVGVVGGEFVGDDVVEVIEVLSITTEVGKANDVPSVVVAIVASVAATAADTE